MSFAQKNLIHSLVLAMLFLIGAVFAGSPTDAFAQTSNTRDPNNPWCSDYQSGALQVVVSCFPTESLCNTYVAGLPGANDCRNMGIDPANDAGTWWQATKNFFSPVTGFLDAAAECAKDAVDCTVGRVFKWLGQIAFYLANLFMTTMSMVMDTAISMTITSGFLGDLRVVDVGWKVVRDACNMVYLFVLLYIAIQTILGIAGGSTKRLVASVIISALLINFSLFFTKVVIDSGNILAKTFWDNMRVTQGTDTVNSFSAWAIGGSALQTSLDPAKAPGGSALSQTRMGIMYFGGAIILFVMGYIFLAGAALMIVRTVGLVFVMILSPFAFLGLGLPKFNYFGQWLGRLTQYTFSAPLLVFFLYIITLVVQTGDINYMAKGNSCGFATLFQGETPACFSIVFQYMIMIIFMIMALHMATSMSGSLGQKAVGWAKGSLGVVGGLGVGAAGFVGRQTLGRVGQRVRESERLQRMAEKGGVLGRVAGRTALWSGDKMARSSFDLRATRVGQGVAGATGINYGKAGGVGGAEKTGTLLGGKTEEQVKDLHKEAARRYPDNPELQRSWVDRKAGKIQEVKTEVTGVDVAGNPVYSKIRKRLKASETSFGKKLDKEIRDKIEADKQKGNLDIAHQVHKNPASIDPVIRANMQGNLGVMTEAFVRGAKPSVIADLKEEMLTNPNFIASYTPAQLRAISANDKVSDNVMRTIKAGVMGRPPEDPSRAWIENIMSKNPDSRWATV